MPSDISRFTFDPKYNFSGVLEQQGRTRVDADGIEQVFIQQYRTRTQTKDVIGQSGVPKEGAAFLLDLLADRSDITIRSGRIYVGGLLCELAASEPLPSYFRQPYAPNPSTEFFDTLEDVEPPTLALQTGTYLAYIEAWQREVNYLNYPHIQEVALGEADTTTRLQTVWQVKLVRVTDGLICEDDSNEWTRITSPSTGLLEARTNPAAVVESPCELPPSAGYKRLENQLYRIEVHQGGDLLADVTFKWSRDNASVETIIEVISGLTLSVESIGRDDVLGFAAGQWVEIVDEASDLHNSPRDLVQILSVNPSTREIELEAGSTVPNFADLINPKLRRWDQSTNATAQGVSTIGRPIDIEGGIQVEFSEGTYQAGDYWLIPARTITADIEWPSGEALSPLGIQKQYCKLGIIQVADDNANIIDIVSDCRPIFPSLTEICAEDICYDSSNCQLSDATTVQEALDVLCQERGGSCTFHVAPVPGWEAVFELIEEGADAQICFQVGTYRLAEAVRIPNKGHLKLIGCGFGTQIRASSEAALVFENCESVLIRDLFAETNSANFEIGNPRLNGALTFLNCALVNVQNVKLRCAEGVLRAATCLTVRNNVNSIGNVRIQNSEFEVGHYQQGILLVNVGQAWVENNALSSYERSSKLPFKRLLEDTAYRAEVRLLWINTDEKLDRNMSLRFRNFSVSFTTHQSFVEAWHLMLEENPPSRILSSREFMGHLQGLTNQIFFDESFRRRYQPFADMYGLVEAGLVGVGTQAITVGGEETRDIRILNNNIQGFLQGVHVGLSNRNRREGVFRAKNITISDNTIAILLPPTTHRLERYGILVGNCSNLVVENNKISLQRIPLNNRSIVVDVIRRNTNNVFITGIRVWGNIGRRLMISKNYISDIIGGETNSFDTGIQVNSITKPSRAVLWAVTWNVVPSRGTALVLTDGVIEENNMT